MRFIVCLFLLFVCNFAYTAEIKFDVQVRLVSGLTIEQVRELNFQSSIVASEHVIQVSPSDRGAAEFIAYGQPGTEVKVKVKQYSIQLVKGNGYELGDWVTASDFTYGGSVDGSGVGRISEGGVLENIRMGAKAYIRDINLNGTYVGNGTITIVYL